jgi:hypothetical protein
MKNVFMDREKTFAVFREVVRLTVEEDCEVGTEEGRLIAQIMTMMMETLGKRNIETVFTHSESPIETIFLNSVIMGLLRNDVSRVLIFPPVPDLEMHMKNVRETCSDFIGWMAGYIERTGDATLRNLEDYMKAMVDDGMMPEDAYAHGIEMLGGRLLDFFNSFHLVLQPSTRIGGKTIRPDMAVWMPSDENVRILIECDGFKYHSNQRTFASDRSRDRALMRQGFKVLRFAGAEICDDPLKAGKELVEYLYSFPVQKQPKLCDLAIQLFDRRSKETIN